MHGEAIMNERIVAGLYRSTESPGAAHWAAPRAAVPMRRKWASPTPLVAFHHAALPVALQALGQEKLMSEPCAARRVGRSLCLL